MRTQTKKQGILGLGKRSTQFYLDALNRQFHSIHGDFHTFPCIVFYIDFNRLNPYLPDDFDELIPELTHILNDCFELPIHSCLIPNITLHETYDVSKLNHRVIHPLELSLAYLLKHGINAVILFGSLHTMNSDYVPKTLNMNAISVLTPCEDDKNIIDNFRKKVYHSEETQEDFHHYKNIVSKYSESHHILIACTELSVYSHQIDTTRIVDMALLQIDKVLSTIE